jgi:hypothetical protein
VLIPHKHMYVSQIVLAGALLGLAGRSSALQLTNSGNFSGTVASQRDRATDAPTSRARVAGITPSPARLTGGDSTEITINLTQPAPDGGIVVRLISSDANIAATPATVRIPFGETGVKVAVVTSPVAADTTVAITAFDGDTVVGTSLVIAAPETKAPFSVGLHPATIKIAPGKSNSVKVTTKVTDGFSNALSLTVSNVPDGVTVTLTPSVIPAPGAGTSVAEITVSGSVPVGTYSLQVTASDGQTSESANLTLKVATPGPGATFQGCWYQQSGNRYQGVQVAVDDPGTYPFNAVLYYGTTCNANDWADQIGFGTLIQFGGFDWIFWFDAFANQSDMSALWYVGNDKSQCVNYTVAPECP